MVLFKHSPPRYRLLTGLPGLLLLILLGTAMPARAILTVNISGTVVRGGCSVATDSTDINVNFGDLLNTDLYASGQSASKPFLLKLTECAAGTSARVTFSGRESTALPGLLALDAGSQASGVAIGIADSTGKLIPLNQASDAFPMVQGANTLSLQGYVKAEPSVVTARNLTPGAFSATATFTLTYD